MMSLNVVAGGQFKVRTSPHGQNAKLTKLTPITAQLRTCSQLALSPAHTGFILLPKHDLRFGATPTPRSADGEQSLSANVLFPVFFFSCHSTNHDHQHVSISLTSWEPLQAAAAAATAAGNVPPPAEQENDQHTHLNHQHEPRST